MVDSPSPDNQDVDPELRRLIGKMLVCGVAIVAFASGFAGQAAEIFTKPFADKFTENALAPAERQMVRAAEVRFVAGVRDIVPVAQNRSDEALLAVGWMVCDEKSGATSRQQIETDLGASARQSRDVSALAETSLCSARADASK